MLTSQQLGEVPELHLDKVTGPALIQKIHQGAGEKSAVGTKN